MNSEFKEEIEKIDEIRKKISEHKKILRIKKKKEELEKIIENNNVINDDEIKNIIREKNRINRGIREKKFIEDEKLDNIENNKVIINNDDENIIEDKRKKINKKTSDYTLKIIKNYHSKPYVNEQTGQTVKNLYHSKKLDRFLLYLEELRNNNILIDNKIDISNKQELIKIVNLM